MTIMLIISHHGCQNKDLRKPPGATYFRDGNVEGFKGREASENIFKLN